MDRVKMGMSGFDEMLDDDFLRESATLVEGPPDMGKTMLGMPFICLIPNAYDLSE